MVWCAGKEPGDVGSSPALSLINFGHVPTVSTLYMCVYVKSPPQSIKRVL